MARSRFWPLGRVLSSALFLWLLFFAIPISFDAGGQLCGLYYTFALELVLSAVVVVRIATGGSRLAWVATVLRASEFVMVPLLLIAFLRTKDIHTPADRLIDLWRFALSRSTGLFTVLEGFATLLVVQFLGHLSHRLMNASESWAISLLVASGGIITNCVYFMYRVYAFHELELADGMLAAALITSTLFISGYSIMSNRGTVFESSLMFAYVVYSVFMICSSCNPSPDIGSLETLGSPWPPIISSNVAVLASAIASAVPQAMMQVWRFMMSTVMSMDSSIAVSLIYRTSVLYLASKVLPVIRYRVKGVALEDKSSTGGVGSSRSSPARAAHPGANGRGLLYTLLQFNPCILIAVYTHLLVQQCEDHCASTTTSAHVSTVAANASLEPASQILLAAITGDERVWRWITVFGTVILWLGELVLGADEAGVVEDTIASHWKID